MVGHLIVALTCAVAVGAYLERVAERTRCGVPAGLAAVAILVFNLVFSVANAVIVLRVLP